MNYVHTKLFILLMLPLLYVPVGVRYVYKVYCDLPIVER